MAWFLRVVEHPDGTWSCRQGLHQLDLHAAFEEAVAHARALAALRPPTELFVHRLDGTVDDLGLVESD